MSKAAREFFDRAMQDHLPPMGAAQAAVEGVKEAAKAFAPALSLKDILQDIRAELKDQMAHGAHEMAAALFRGDAFVMYPRTNQADGPDHGLADQQQEQSRSGREL